MDEIEEIQEVFEDIVQHPIHYFIILVAIEIKILLKQLQEKSK